MFGELRRVVLGNVDREKGAWTDSVGGRHV